MRTYPDAGPGTDGSPRIDAPATSCDGVDCSALRTACARATCNPATGECEAEPFPNGTACSDACTTGGTCTDGACTGETSIDCSAMNAPCVMGTCDPATGACVAMPLGDGAGCDDGDACTTPDICMGGACSGPPLDCTDAVGPCQVGTCNPETGRCDGTPVADGMACDDASACTTGDACLAGACTGAAVDCSAMSMGCTLGVCNPATGACETAMAAEGAACNDGDACTMTDVCTSGLCAGAPMPQCNSMCAEAVTVTDGSILPAQDGASGVDTLSFTGCGSTLFHALYYTATVPAGNALVVTATPLGAYNPVIRVLSTCGATSCLGFASGSSTGQPETLFYTNATTAAQTVIIAVGSTTTTTGGFDLAVEIGPGPANRVCSTASALASGVTLSAQQEGLGTDDSTFSGCGSSAFDVLYYSVTVPARLRLSVAVVPTGSWNPVIRILPSCTATTCLANGNTGFSGQPEGATYTNSTSSPVTVIVAVGSASSTVHGLFDITVDASPPPYTRTMFSGTCDDTSTGMSLTGAVGDDSTSSRRALPFTFTLAGTAMTNYAVSSNGNVQLFPGASGSGNSDFDNVPIPSAFAPNAYIAPFWDDLTSQSTSEVRVQTFGTAPNRRFVVDWRDFKFFSVGSETHLRFQVKIFESTNVIQLHYCRLFTGGTSTARVTGSSATIGVENATGTDGFQHSFNMADSVSTAQAIRLTPAASP